MGLASVGREDAKDFIKHDAVWEVKIQHACGVEKRSIKPGCHCTWQPRLEAFNQTTWPISMIELTGEEGEMGVYHV